MYIAILLVDPLVKLNPADTLTYRAGSFSMGILPLPRFSAYTSNPARQPLSVYDKLLYYYNSTHVHRDDQLSDLGIKPILEILIAEWSNVGHIIECEVNRLEYTQENFKEATFDAMRQNLLSLHMWRRRLTTYNDILDHTLAFCRDRNLTAALSDHLCLPTKRLQDIQRQFEKLKEKAEKQVSDVRDQITIEHGKQSVREASRVTQLTIAALIFLPLSFVASLFSMGGSFAVDSERGWIFFAVAMPLTVLVTFVGLYPLQQREKKEILRDDLNSEFLNVLGLSY